MTESDRVVEIRDPEIDLDEIMRRVRQRLQQRRAQVDAQGLDYDRAVDDKSSAVVSGRFPAGLHNELQWLQTNADGVIVSLAMRDRQIPLFNFLLFPLEKLLHRLALKYINMLAGRQAVINKTTAQVLGDLVGALEKDREELEQEMAELHQRLTKIEDELERIHSR